MKLNKRSLALLSLLTIVGLFGLVLGHMMKSNFIMIFFGIVEFIGALSFGSLMKINNHNG